MNRHCHSSDHGRSAPGCRKHTSAGFSLSEMIITISILAVLSGIVIMSMQGSFGASQEVLARARVEMLNSGLHSYSMALPEVAYSRSDGGVIDEFLVLRDLQFRHPNPNRVTIGSPYVPPEYNPKDSSSSNDFRIRWNGRTFELLRPGQQGTGFLMVFDGSDFTDPFKFDPNYSPGSR